MTTTEQLAQALRECAEAAWHKDSHRVYFDSTVAFHPHYNFYGLDGIQREEFLGEHDCIVWPCGSGRKWSAYCTYQGSMWIESFDTVEEAKAVCMELLAKVSPNDPFVKACALLAAHEAEKAKAAPVAVPLTDEELRDALRQCPHDAVENLRVRWLYATDFARTIERTLAARWGVNLEGGQE
jgi:hypothetical protein